MSEDQLDPQLVAAFKNRAMIYHHIFEVLTRRLGEAAATEILEEAIYNRGLEIGRRFRDVSADDMAGIRDAFLAFIPGPSGALFEPEVLRCDAEGVDIQLRRCLLKDAWQEAGLSEAAVAKLCSIAGKVDNGTFEGAGFAFSAETWQPGRQGCCLLHIRPGPPRRSEG